WKTGLSRSPILRVLILYEKSCRPRIGIAGTSPAMTADGVVRLPLPPLDLFDLVGLGAAWRHHLDIGAFRLADQRARERRGDRDLAFLGVGLGLADKLPDLFLLGIFVDQRHGGAEFDGIARELRHVDHL